MCGWQTVGEAERVKGGGTSLLNPTGHFGVKKKGLPFFTSTKRIIFLFPPWNTSVFADCSFFFFILRKFKVKLRFLLSTWLLGLSMGPQNKRELRTINPSPHFPRIFGCVWPCSPFLARVVQNKPLTTIDRVSATFGIFGENCANNGHMRPT